MFYLDLSGTVSPAGHTLAKMEFPSSVLIQGEGGVSIPGCRQPLSASIGSWKYQQQDVVFVRGWFPVRAFYKHAAIHQTSCRPPLVWLTLTLPFCAASLVAHSLSPLSFSSPSQLTSVTLAKQTESAGLLRLQGAAFPGEKERQEWEAEQEEARRRDHRRIGTVRRNPNQAVLTLEVKTDTLGHDIWS